MKLDVDTTSITLRRETGDKALSHESAVTHHMRRLLNETRLFPGTWVRMYPDRHGLTSCRQGLRNRKAGLVLWHSRYQIEAAHRAFNSGLVMYTLIRG